MVGSKKTVDTKYITYRNWKNVDHSTLHKDMEDLQSWFDKETSGFNLDDLVETYNRKMQALADAHAPRRTILIKRNPDPWYTAKTT